MNFRLIKISSSPGSLFNLCLAVDLAENDWIRLRSYSDAEVYAGAVVDGAGDVQEWLEIWVQTTASLAVTETEKANFLTNPMLDERWRKRCLTLREVSPGGAYACDWETNYQFPMQWDFESDSLVPITHAETGEAWEVCRDDDLLNQYDLPVYSQTYQRFLWQPSLGADSLFLATGGSAVENEKVKNALAFFSTDGKICFNPGGGLMMVRVLAPLGLEEFGGLISGAEWPMPGKVLFPTQETAPYNRLGDAVEITQGSHHLMTALKGKEAYWAENFFLKLQLIADLFEKVRQVVKQQQMPLLTLTEDSFRVRLGEMGCSLPTLWNFNVVLAHADDSLLEKIDAENTRFFRLAKKLEQSIYRPVSVTGRLAGRGSLRLRAVESASHGVWVEGTLETPERIHYSGSDLVYLVIPASAKAIGVYAHLSDEESLTQGELRFRSLPQSLSPEQVAALDKLKGVVVETSFEVQPVVRTPSDLYSLAVIAAQILLTNEGHPLPVAIDECLSLAKEMASAKKAGEDYNELLTSIVDSDSRWLSTLGPGQLTWETTDPDEIFSAIPRSLWWDTIGWLIRLFPGTGPDSYCSDYGDVPPLALEAVFDSPISDLNQLIQRAKALLFVEWAVNKEIRSVIQALKED